MRDDFAETVSRELDRISGVPVAQILETRAAFPKQQLSFDILLETEEAWQGLDLCARIARKGLLVTNLVYRKPGRILIQLRDDPATHPAELVALMGSAPDVTVVRWTTVLGGPA